MAGGGRRSPPPKGGGGDGGNGKGAGGKAKGSGSGASRRGAVEGSSDGRLAVGGPDVGGQDFAQVHGKITRSKAKVTCTEEEISVSDDEVLRLGVASIVKAGGVPHLPSKSVTKNAEARQDKARGRGSHGGSGSRETVTPSGTDKNSADDFMEAENSLQSVTGSEDSDVEMSSSSYKASGDEDGTSSGEDDCSSMDVQKDLAIHSQQRNMDSTGREKSSKLQTQLKQYSRSPLKHQASSQGHSSGRVLNGIHVNSDGEEVITQSKHKLHLQEDSVTLGKGISVPSSLPGMTASRHSMDLDGVGNLAAKNLSCDHPIASELMGGSASSPVSAMGTSYAGPPPSYSRDTPVRTQGDREFAPTEFHSSSLQYLANLKSKGPDSPQLYGSTIFGSPLNGGTSIPSNSKTQNISQPGNPFSPNNGGPPQGNLHNVWKKPQHIPIAWDKNRSDFVNEAGVIQLNMEKVWKNVHKLEGALVGKTLGRHLPYSMLKADLSRLWSQFGLFKLTSISNDCFICVFENATARDAVLMGGPWFVAGSVIGLDAWRPDFSPDSLDGFTAPVWLRLPHLPLHYWDEENIARIAGIVGHPLWLDANTNSWVRNAYARICVRVNLANRLLAGAWIDGIKGKFYQRFEYEGISHLCFNCGKVGHKHVHCKEVKIGKATKHEVDCSSSHSHGVQQSVFDGPPTSPPEANHTASKVFSKNQNSSQMEVQHPACSNADHMMASNMAAHGLLSKGSTAVSQQVQVNSPASEINSECPIALTNPRSSSPDEDYGPWTLVARRKPPPRKLMGAAAVKPNHQRQNAPLGQPTMNTKGVLLPSGGSTSANGKGIKAVLAPDHPDFQTANGQSGLIFTSLKQQQPSIPKVPKQRFDRALSRLGPAELQHRKRKKDSLGMPAGGDASPAVE